MGLYKEIKQDDGVVTCYHRILYMMQAVNDYTAIAVLSYVDSDSRASEKESVITQPYQKSITYNTSYDPAMNVEKAYDYLKTLPQFEGAVDV